MDTLEKGKRYYIRYHIIGAGGPKACVATYLGDNDRNEALFSFRPTAGTSPIRKDAILDAQSVSHETPHMLPRKSPSR